MDCPLPLSRNLISTPYAPLVDAGAEGRPMHLLGTDALGRDIASRLLYAGRISLSVALIVTLLNISLGTVVGAVAGAWRRWTIRS